jgi:hypothetical protein
MSCRRAFEIDLPGFLADPRAPAHADFRDHYPRCPVCSAELRAWSELAAQLASAGSAHPAPERLLRFADARAALAAVERAALESHLARCAACRDELSALAGFDPAALAAAAPARAGRGGLRAFAAALRGTLWHPAFAYALLLLLAVPTVYTLVGRNARIQAARERAPAAADEAPEDAGLREDAGRSGEAAAPAPAAPIAPPSPRPQAPAPKRERALAKEAAAPPAAQPAPDAALEQAPPEAAFAEERREPAPNAEVFAAAEPGRGKDAAAEPQAASRAAAPAEREAGAAGEPVSLRALGSVGAEAAPGAAALRFERRAAGTLALRVPVAPGAGEVEVRVLAPDGRVLAQRFSAAGGEVELLVADGWLGAGAHRVELRAAGGVSIFSATPP